MSITVLRTVNQAIEFAERALNVWFSNGRYANKRIPSKYDEAHPKDMEIWFNSTPDFDERIRREFLSDIDHVAHGHYGIIQSENHLQAFPHHTLSCLICLDQFPRHIYRHSARAFTYDSKAKILSSFMIDKGIDKRLPYIERAFIHLPFVHNESLEDQKFSVKYCQRLAQEVNNDLNASENLRSFINLFLIFAIRHYDIIQEFGRFPHRNQVLDRRSNYKEEMFLKNGGDRFGQ